MSETHIYEVNCTLLTHVPCLRIQGYKTYCFMQKTFKLILCSKERQENKTCHCYKHPKEDYWDEIFLASSWPFHESQALFSVD